MRPRRKAAEYVSEDDPDWKRIVDASMRPRRKAAEYHRRQIRRSPAAPGFNEAAAKSRGIQPKLAKLSMGDRRFNEAAAKSRGIRSPRQHSVAQQLDASMRPRRKAAEYARQLDFGDLSHARASMRPRRKAAEYRLPLRSPNE